MTRDHALLALEWMLDGPRPALALVVGIVAAVGAVAGGLPPWLGELSVFVGAAWWFAGVML
jgi:hypothetical protein